MTHHSIATPTRVRRSAVRVAMVTAPLTVVALGLWAAMPDWLPERPTLWFAVYQLLLLVSIGSGMVALLAGGQLAIAKAFMAGYNTGLAVSEQQHDTDHDGDGPPSGPQPMPLRVVE